MEEIIINNKNEPPTLRKEVMVAIANLKTNKSLGENGIAEIMTWDIGTWPEN